MTIDRFLKRSKSHSDDSSDTPLLFEVLGSTDPSDGDAGTQIDAVTRALLESSSDCVKVLDVDGRLLGMNE